MAFPQFSVGPWLFSRVVAIGHPPWQTVHPKFSMGWRSTSGWVLKGCGASLNLKSSIPRWQVSQRSARFSFSIQRCRTPNWKSSISNSPAAFWIKRFLKSFWYGRYDGWNYFQSSDKKKKSIIRLITANTLIILLFSIKYLGKFYSIGLNGYCLLSTAPTASKVPS